MTRILTLFAAAALIACVTPKATMPPPDTVGPSGKKKPSASDVSTPQSQ